MVVELCSENCGVPSIMSPRISFSHDFAQSDFIPLEGQQQQHPLRSNSSGLNSINNKNNNIDFDFDFCVHESTVLESSSADELFSHGIILPTTQINNNNKKIASFPLKLKQTSSTTTQQQQAPQPQHHHHHPLPLPSPSPSPSPIQTPYGIINDNNGCSSTSKNNSSKKDKSFWGFKRSSSCGSGYGASLCPLPLLSRSHSTGSSSSSSPSVNNKRMSLSKEGVNANGNVKHQNSAQRGTSSSTNTRSSSSSHSLLGQNNHQKPPLKRSHTHTHGAYAANSTFRVTPVLNVPSTNLFGFGSIFSNNRHKSKKK